MGTSRFANVPCAVLYKMPCSPLNQQPSQTTCRIAERQTATGGLNGRPEKLQDVCYSWWCLSSLAALNRLEWIDRQALTDFILECQDEEKGGISDRPDTMADVFHTFFGLAGLSLMGYPGLAEIDPIYALPSKVVERLGLKSQVFPKPSV